MGYPFDDNPLDEYLNELFLLRADELTLWSRLSDRSMSPQERAAASTELQEIRSQIRDLNDRYRLAPRDYDVFKSLPELAVERFDREHPRPEDGPCQHHTLRLSRRTFRNGSIHVVRQCLDCGRQRGAVPKCDTNVDSLPPFDDSLSDRLNSYANWWRTERGRILSEAINQGNDVPEFPWSDFEHSYRERQPPPFPETCVHPQEEYRLRHYSNGSQAVVRQCVICGHHIESVGKSLVPNWDNLAPYDEELPVTVATAMSRWHQERYEASELARKDFRRDVQARIRLGELQVQDNSKFGTYYESLQWQRTRQRILERDSHECQACGALAECVHHIVYLRLGAENDLDLISLCNDCHDLIHREQRKLGNVWRMPPKDIRRLREDIAARPQDG